MFAGNNIISIENNVLPVKLKMCYNIMRVEIFHFTHLYYNKFEIIKFII